jgi:hypothetical protein
MAMTMQGQELFVSTLAKILVDVVVQNDPEYNKFMDGIISGLITMAKVEKLLDDDEAEMAIAIINNRAKEMIQLFNLGNDSYDDIDDIINRALNSDD